MAESGNRVMIEYYNANDRFQSYVNKYAMNNGINAEEALSHRIVREVYEQYISN